MKIGFDISQTAESKAGCGFYADQLVQALAATDRINEYILYPVFYDYRPLVPENATSIEENNFKKSEKDAEDFLGGCNDNLDIIHSNNFRYPYGTKAKKVVTIYDVCFMDYPEYTTEANRLFCYSGVFDSMLKADKIIAISQYTKSRLLHYFPAIDETKIAVIYCGNRDTLLKEKDNLNVLKKFQLKQEEYFLSVGTIEPRKNYQTLLLAYSEYKIRTKSHKKLCIAGGYGWLEDKFKEKIKDLNLEKDVIITEYVSDEELANLYRHSFAFVYPTWYEGFGMPVLEAMNFKKPVIVSAVSSVPEITSEAAILANPYMPSTFTNGMLLIEEDREKYLQLSQNGYQRAQLFSWKKAAQELVNVYENLMRD